ncbi:MAG TPA: fibronectin type III domain-containing protein [Bacteroidia bacterium]|jgi:hypothetical protein|nr:fibronectin type III domain-containing protein [Bacteroidia bacterium]
MATTGKITKRQVALRLKYKSTPQLIADTKHYLDNLSGNVYFPSPYPALADVSAQLQVVETCYTISQMRERGAADKTRAERKDLERLLKALAAHVEYVSNSDPDNAENRILSSGMPLKKPSSRKPKTFTTILTEVPGQVKLNSKRQSQSSCYVYEMSTNPSDESGWTVVATTNNVKAFVNDLLPDIRYYFRVRVITKREPGTWSSVVNLVMQ